MKLNDYLRDQGRGSCQDLAERLEVPAPLVSQWSNGVRPVPIERCLEIERATNGAVSRRDLRPDDWGRIWPELAEAPAQSTTSA